MEVYGREEYLPSNAPFTSSLDEAYREVLSEGKRPLILDLGANIGVSALQFSERFPEASVIALEPSESNFKQLEANCRSASNVKSHLAAVNASDAQLNLFDGPESANNAFRTFSAEGPQPIAMVPGISPETLLAQHSEFQPLLVKIDIEGFESELFKNRPNWIEQFPFVMTELHDWMLWGQASSNSMLLATLNSKRDIVISGENLLMATPRGPGASDD